MATVGPSNAFQRDDRSQSHAAVDASWRTVAEQRQRKARYECINIDKLDREIDEQEDEARKLTLMMNSYSKYRSRIRSRVFSLRLLTQPFRQFSSEKSIWLIFLVAKLSNSFHLYFSRKRPSFPKWFISALDFTKMRERAIKSYSAGPRPVA